MQDDFFVDRRDNVLKQIFTENTAICLIIDHFLTDASNPGHQVDQFGENRGVISRKLRRQILLKKFAKSVLDSPNDFSILQLRLPFRVEKRHQKDQKHNCLIQSPLWQESRHHLAEVGGHLAAVQLVVVVQRHQALVVFFVLFEQLITIY